MKVEIYYKGVKKGSRFFQKDELLVGSSEGCDLKLKVQGVGSRHARVYKEDDRIMIEALDLKNDVLINGEKIQKKEFTTFFPVQLGPFISISLVDDQVLKPKSGFGKGPLSSARNSQKSKLKTTASKSKWGAGFKAMAALAFAVSAAAVFFYIKNLEIEKSNSESYADRHKASDQIALLPSSAARKQARCESELGSCQFFGLKPDGGEGVLIKDRVLYLHKNLKGSSEEQARKIAVSLFLSPKIFGAFRYSGKINAVVITVFSKKFGVVKDLTEFIVKRNKTLNLTPPQTQVLKAFVERDEKIEEVIAALKQRNLNVTFKETKELD